MWDFLTEFPSMGRRDLSTLRQSIDEAFRAFSRAYGEALENFFSPLLHFLVWFEKLLLATPWPLILLVIGGLCWLGSRSWKITLGAVLAFLAIGYFDMWEDTMATLAIISVATILCIAIGIPLGIVMAKSDRAQGAITPVLDVMQTIPSFVYLIPVVMLLGIGKVPGLLAVCIYAIPPIVRLTNLGIRLVDREVLEAADAFGASPREKLFGVQIPLALPNIFAGVNQTIMMALAMVVIASMIGVKGLGVPVLRAISNQYLALGLMNGLAIVALAIIFDRVSQTYWPAPAKLPRGEREVTAPKIRIRNLYKIFGKAPQKALAEVRKGTGKEALLEQTGHVLGVDNVSLDIPARQLQVIMGLSGSGKSTLIRHLNRLIEPTAGEILVDGQDVVQLGPEELRDLRRFKMSMVFQHFGLFPHRRVIENVAYGLNVQGVEEGEARKRALHWIERVGLSGYEERYPGQLSGGMRQRVGLARGLATDAEILLMDEAFSALDPLIRYDMQSILIELQKELHKTIVFITHDLDEALRLGDNIAILRDGALVQEGGAQDIVLRPADAYIEDFIKDINRAKVIKLGSIVAPLGPEESWASHPRLDAETILEEALPRIARTPGQIVVVEAAGQPRGLVSIADAVEALHG